MQAKVNPYLRPLYDALYRFLDVGRVQNLLENDVIEIAPFAYMRGRTLSRSYIILDEGQNCTLSQLKMFLTRLGEDSKMVITGDPTQDDLEKGLKSGLERIAFRLKDIMGIELVCLSKRDIVRHPLVVKILEKIDTEKQ